ncbi:hypothetical protein [Sorangium sp. So ce1151]|uniref:hypothetical protein n=1 Tax=Sorangium sp. So ce1151 TaxID=3133332 RepID=UPI003F63C481
MPFERSADLVATGLDVEAVLRLPPPEEPAVQEDLRFRVTENELDSNDLALRSEQAVLEALPLRGGELSAVEQGAP